MLYFILWVVFLLFVILAIPITSMLENRKYRAAKPRRGDDEIGEEPIDAEPASDDFDGNAEMGQGDDLGAFADTTPAGGDDFSAFDEEFK